MQDVDLKTAAGFFSLLVFRGITYNTSFLLDEKQVNFQSFDHWHTTLAEVRARKVLSDINWEKYICKMNAYGGSAISQRTSANANSFWELAHEWVEEVDKCKGSLSFADATAFIKRNAKKLPSVGPLIQLLILGEHCFSCWPQLADCIISCQVTWHLWELWANPPLMILYLHLCRRMQVE